MIARQEIVDEARRYLETPFLHQGRVPGACLDCAGVVVCAAQSLGLSGEYIDITDYPRDPATQKMVDILDRHLDKIPFEKALPGDVLLLAWAQNPQHLAIFTGIGTIIHAHEDARRVVETRLTKELIRCIRGTYRFRGIS